MSFLDSSSLPLKHPSGKYIYIGIPKNAYSTHTVFLEKQCGWEKQRSLYSISEKGTEEYKPEELIYFSHIRNPIDRYIKGIARVLFALYKNKQTLSFERLKFADDEILKLIFTSVYDQHLTPLFNIIPPNMDPYSINWIPLDHHTYSSEELTNHIFKKYDLNIIIEKKSRRNVSNLEGLELQNFIRSKILNENGEPKKFFNHFYELFLSKDDKLYNHVIDSFNNQFKTLDNI